MTRTHTTSNSGTSIRRSTSPVLVDSNFHVDPGETVAIIGRSGVGKSVTLSHIMGFLKPDSGRVIVAHEDITDFSEAELRRIRKKVTMVFQSGALFDSLTVAENVLFSLELREDYDEQNKEDVVNGLLEMVDIAGGRERLSGRPLHRLQARRGHRPRAGRAAAVHPLRRAHHHGGPHHVRPPRRPDAAAQAASCKLTSVVVTHDLDLMYKVADRVVFLYEGSVIFFGPVADLEKSEHPHIQEFLEMDRVVKVYKFWPSKVINI